MRAVTLVRHRAFRHLGVCDPALLASAICFCPLTSLWTSCFACLCHLLLSSDLSLGLNHLTSVIIVCLDLDLGQDRELSLGATKILHLFPGALGGSRGVPACFPETSWAVPGTAKPPFGCAFENVMEKVALKVSK